MTTMHVCAHSITVLTNPEHSALVTECIIHALGARTYGLCKFLPQQKISYTIILWSHEQVLRVVHPMLDSNRGVGQHSRHQYCVHTTKHANSA